MITFFKTNPRVAVTSAIFLALCLGAIWFYRAGAKSEKAEQEQAQTTQAARKADGEALVLRDKTNAATAASAAAARASAASAAEQEPEWAQQPIPEAFKEILND